MVGEFDGADASGAEERDEVVKKWVHRPVLPTTSELSILKNKNKF